jgi:hypothetical protein
VRMGRFIGSCRDFGGAPGRGREGFGEGWGRFGGREGGDDGVDGEGVVGCR